MPPAHSAFPVADSAADDCGTVEEAKSFMSVCEKLFTAVELTQEEEEWIDHQNKEKGDDVRTLLHKTENCTWVREEFSNNYFVSSKEKAFPIAYAINMNLYPQQVLRFLKVIYRPHNVHCVHYDSKTDVFAKKIMHNVASCLGNVFISRRTESVYWGWYTLEEAYLDCFSELMLAREMYPWKYIITLCGKELPLRTNAEIVSMLEPLKGTSSVQLVGEDGLDESKYKWKWSLNTLTGWITKRDSRLPPIPHNLKVYKSWAYVALSHQFVEHLLCSPVGRELREYMKDVRIPEENFYAMLFMEPNTPGGYRPELEKHIFPVVSYIWMDGDHHGTRRKWYLKFHPETICTGRELHGICMVCAKDLHRVSYRPGIIGQTSDSYLKTGPTTYEGPDRGPLFHNRYMMEWDNVVMLCMEGELRRRNLIERARKCSV